MRQVARPQRISRWRIGPVRQYDARRPGFAGEHWLVLGAGLAALLASRRSPSPLRRTVGSALGSALLYRAASGRDGLAKVMRRPPFGP